jgi:hypothetical protein
MRLVVDTNILVAELLREPGQILLASPALDLYVAERTWSEAQHEIRRRATILETDSIDVNGSTADSRTNGLGQKPSSTIGRHPLCTQASKTGSTSVQS